jgi:5-methylcytosine-specific restriction enzyme subunit McrC
VENYYLYEFSTRLHLEKEAKLLPEQIRALEEHLQAMWDKRPAAEKRGKTGLPRTEQQFVKFHRNGTISARNYVGVIRCGSATMHILPKIFGSATLADKPAESHLQLIQAHLYWWLSYSERFRFPRNLTSFEALPSDFSEILMLLFAQHTHGLLSRSYYQDYQEVHEEASAMRGRLNFPAYATNYATGRAHYLPCTYDSFQPDNGFNRILKHVIYRLLHLTEQSTTRQLLQEMYFLLDAVTDQPATATDCAGVILPPLFADYQVTLEYCRLFLEGTSPMATDTIKQEVFALLLPSEVIFEEFLDGFIRDHFSDQYQISSQTDDLYLARSQRPGSITIKRQFQLRHDLLIESLPGRAKIQPLIMDAKYKLIPLNSGGYIKSQAVSQPDMYQLVSYAFRRGTRRACLLYPDTLDQPSTSVAANSINFYIDDALHTGSTCITAYRVPIICQSSVDGDYQESFTQLEQKLYYFLREVLAYQPSVTLK